MTRLHKWFLHVMVFMMRLAMALLPFLARPFIRWYANQEALACAYRGEDGNAYVMYFTGWGRSNHMLEKKTKNGWVDVPTEHPQPFASDQIVFVRVFDAHLGDRYRLRSTRPDGKRVRSAFMDIKENTAWQYEPDARLQTSHTMTFSWNKLKSYTAMIYLHTVFQNEHMISGIYTAARSWTFPHIQTAPLSLTNHAPTPLHEETSYTYRTIAVDFEGWVSFVKTGTVAYYT